MITINRRNLSLAAGMAAAVALTAGALIASTARADSGLPVGRPAPAFTAMDSHGDLVSLSDFTGQTVVLEWTNEGCPFVRKHYAQPPGNMQGLQADAEADGTVWLTVISSAPGKQGHADGSGANQWTEEHGAKPAHVLLDPEGELGRLYQAKTTPHMFIIGPKGQVAYQGAIDSVASANVADIASATNYVREALNSLAAGESINVSTTKPYGCSVKY
ncbi:redoxin domain-containing protein [uncultured Hyphomonas sp.]|uniref:redoxin domain-containing protein n=1 Tax=uncultured Hyphomonas sp. TaxID=225298 RepID=UPI002AAAE477|nr:redoxin domain-containing protein [uncultured Hyphomonas sp.]